MIEGPIEGPMISTRCCTVLLYGVDSGVNAAMLRIRECDHYTLMSMLARAVVGVV